MTWCLLCLICSPGLSADILRVPTGWTSPAPGYWLADKAGRDVVAGWTSDRESVKILRQGLSDLRDEIAASRDETRRLVEELRASLAEERTIHKQELRKARATGMLWLVVGAGVGALASK